MHMWTHTHFLKKAQRLLHNHLFTEKQVRPLPTHKHSIHKHTPNTHTHINPHKCEHALAETCTNTKLLRKKKTAKLLFWFTNRVLLSYLESNVAGIFTISGLTKNQIKFISGDLLCLVGEGGQGTMNEKGQVILFCSPGERTGPK